MTGRAFKPGSQFSYVGLVKELTPGISWGARSWLRAPTSKVKLQELTVTLTPTSDHATTGHYSILLFAEAADTKLWIPHLCGEDVIEGDILFFDTSDPETIVMTETFSVPVSERITE